jgi:TolB-like protein/Flp pilus assembly protein TadD
LSRGLGVYKRQAKLDHPNISAVYETGSDQGQTFIVMQYVEGDTLARRIQRGRIPIDEALELAVQAADALAEAHASGIVHRDIKPANIMITPRGQVKVMDFGLATVAREETAEPGGGETQAVLTEAGALMGTTAYMSPEQVRGEALDPRSDIFSFGGVLYEMATGRQPFAGRSSADTVAAILTKEAPAFDPDGLPEWQRITRKCLARNKDDRYRSARDLLVDLRSLRRQHDSGAVAAGGAVVSTWRRSRLVYSAAAIVTFLIVAAIVFATRALDSSRAAPRQIRSLAVLPFVNAGGDQTTEYLSEGITDSLINSFSHLPQLKVMARTTTFRYKGKDSDAPAIARALKVDAVITGRVSQRGDTLIVQADLLDAVDGSQVWGDRYTRKVTDIFVVQEQIAKEIASRLRLELTGEEQQGLSKRYTDNIGAYQNYLQGRSFAQRRTRQDLLAAIGYYEKAIEQDKSYALAYAGLADAYTNLVPRGYIASEEGKRRAEQAARRALALDPGLAEAHTAAGELEVFKAPYDFVTADRELLRALELSPSLSAGYDFLAVSRAEQGRLDEALEAWTRGREFDPLSPIIARMASYIYVLKRDYPRALERYRQSLELGPSFIVHMEVEIYVQNGLLDDALAALAKARAERQDDSYLIYGTGVVYAAQGRREDAVGMIDELQRTAPSKSSVAHLIARIYATLKDNDAAIMWLERALADGAIPIFYKDAPMWDSLRGDPRFADLLRRMGIPVG